MARRRSRKVSLESHPWSDGTNNSGLQGNETFFDEAAEQSAIAAPSHTASITWKSERVKEKEVYERARQRVRHFAPEMFKAHAKPTLAPAGIFPQNVVEWNEHKRAMLEMAETAKLDDIANLKRHIAALEKAHRIPVGRARPLVAFGGKTFNDGLSPVLALPTTSSPWPSGNMAEVAEWPSLAEMQWNGDNRQNGHAKTKCGRFLPPPRLPAVGTDTSFQDQPLIKPFPLDETGPIYTNGPRPDEVRNHNFLMDRDPDFEAEGAIWLGSELMEVIGKWEPRRTPDWQLALNTVIEVPEHSHIPEAPVAHYPYAHQGVVPGYGYVHGLYMGEQYWDEDQSELYGPGDGWN